jgi:nicotinamide-nucleotide amidase
VLTAIPGSSQYFKGGVVTYATESKVEVLGVPENVIEEHTVVSAQVAEEMAARVRQKFGADIAISTTGNAGPEKGDSDAEVGTVYIGFATAEKVYSEKFDLGQPREKVIERAVNKALEHIYKEILKN